MTDPAVEPLVEEENASDYSGDTLQSQDGPLTADEPGKTREQEAPAPALEPIEQPTTPISLRLSRMGDRAIQRVTGGNAFLRGRLYAKRKIVENLNHEGNTVSGTIAVRSSEVPYSTSVTLQEDDSFVSQCTCPGWRGPTGHCKHVAAVMVALRDRVRVPKRPNEFNNQQQSFGDRRQGMRGELQTYSTVSVGGRRGRKSRRRRRGLPGGGSYAETEGFEMISARELEGKPTDSQGLMEAWLPAEALTRPLSFEYRLGIRAASITVTPVIAGSRQTMQIGELLSHFNMVAPEDRPLFRALSRHSNRGTSATSELRGEEAAEVISMLKGRRVLLEPASMELRFSDEPLQPKLELDRANGNGVRIRVTFIQPSNDRRFSLSSGAWFEGTPGWQIDMTEGVARPVSGQITPAWLQALYRSPTLVYPSENLPDLLGGYVPRVAASLGADLPDLSSIADLVDSDAHIQLRADGDLLVARVRLQVRYEDHVFDIPPSGFPSPLAFLNPARPGGRPRVVRRDVGAEVAAVQLLLNQGFKPAESADALVVDGDNAISFWTEGIGELPEKWDRFIPDDLVDVTIRDEAVTPQMRVSSGVDWLDLAISFTAGSAIVDEEELRMCLEKGRRLVKLKDGSYAPVDPEEVGEVLSRMAEIYASSGTREKLPLSQIGRIQDLIKFVPDANVSASTQDLFKKLAEIQEIPEIEPPKKLHAELRPYQKSGFSWLVFIHGLRSGGILADDMGLGKTLQTIALFLWSEGEEKKKKVPSLVVAPTSVVPNWQMEIEKFAPNLKTVVWQGPNRHQKREEIEEADVLITSYALLRRDEELLNALDFYYVVLDEAQHIKNPMSNTARAAKKLKSERRLALTGTPIENRLSELWSILDFVSPGLVGSLKQFEERYARPIDRGDKDSAERLRRTVKPFVLRRLKVDVAKDLPEKIEQEIIVPLTEDQQQLYKQILREVRQNVMSEVEKQGVNRSHIQILAALTRLRQVACDPRLMKLQDTSFEDGDSGKMGALREILEEAMAGNHRVLVFSQFVEMLTLIRASLDADKIPYEYLDGSTKNRMERVLRFNSEEGAPIFLISLKAGGTGLNLVGADTVVHFDPWWNPAVEDQATDRAHRIGQDKIVTVYRLIAKGTVEEKILQLSAKKRELMTSVLSAEGTPLKGLTEADVESLFAD